MLFVRIYEKPFGGAACGSCPTVLRLTNPDPEVTCKECRDYQIFEYSCPICETMIKSTSTDIFIGQYACCCEQPDIQLLLDDQRERRGYHYYEGWYQDDNVAIEKANEEVLWP